MSTNSDLEWQSLYCELITDHKSWITKAQELLYCAGIIYENAESFDTVHLGRTIAVHLLLYAYAFENLFKGIIMAKKKNQGLTIKVNPTLNHNLLKLGKEAEINCTPLEISLLGNLQYYGEIQGRYRLPRDWETFKKQSMGGFVLNDFNEIAKLIYKVEDKYKEIGIDVDILNISYDSTSNGISSRIERKITLPVYPKPSQETDKKNK
jgi:hypothetical protein